MRLQGIFAHVRPSKPVQICTYANSPWIGHPCTVTTQTIVRRRYGTYDLREVGTNKACSRSPKIRWQQCEGTIMKSHKNYDRNVYLTHTFRVGDQVFQERTSFLDSARKKSALEGYNKLLPHKQGPYRVTDIFENTSHMVQNSLENKVSIHWKILRPASTRNFNDNRGERKECAHE